jgi:hypothetical protein
MKKAAILVFLIWAAACALAADSYGTVSSLLQFHGDLADLTAPNAAIDPARLYLVEGMITAIRVVNDTAGAYYAEADFISARYSEDDSIRTFKVILVFSRPVFQPLLVAKAGRALQEGQIGVNSRGLALIQYVNSVPGAGQEHIPVFLAHDFRILK